MGLLNEMIQKMNPFSDTFQELRKVEDNILDQIDRNSIGLGDVEAFSIERDEELGNQQVDSTNVDASLRSYVSFENFSSNKIEKINLYRTMAKYPEISQVLHIFCNQAIVEDAQHRICSLDFTDELHIDKTTQETLKNEFEKYVSVILKGRDTLFDLFKRFIIEAELYVEYIIDDKSKGLIGFKTLPVHTINPIYDSNGNIDHFEQRVQGKDPIKLEKNQVGYVNWGTFGTSLWDVRGYLDDAIKTYNQLRALEDAIVVYRLVRAPERRIWNISVGRMPTTKAEEYLRKVIAKYKKTVSYNEETGLVDAAKNVQSITEDFWFARREGDSTSVEVLQSGMNLGEITDLDYFKDKLYTALKVPTSKFKPGEAGVYQNGIELERQELDWHLFVLRALNRFKPIILNGFIEHIRLKYAGDSKILKYINKRELFDIYFVPSTYFKQIREIETNTRKLTMLNDFKDMIITDDNDGEIKPFELEFFLREMCNFPDDIVIKMKEYRKKFIKSKKKDEADSESNEDAGLDLPGIDSEIGQEDIGNTEETPVEAETPTETTQG